MIDAWLEAEVELLQRFDSWQTSLFQPGFPAAAPCTGMSTYFGLTEALVVKTCIFMLLTRTKGGKEP
ncbi:hypothetical protein N4Q68_26750 [Salmonella enterica subsp. enterica serovar Montevideo]